MHGLRSDFGSLNQDKMCPLGCGEIDKLENIPTCSVLRQHHKSRENTHTDVKCQDIFSSDILKQQKITEMFSQLGKGSKKKSDGRFSTKKKNK